MAHDTEYDLRRSCKGKQNHADPIYALMACMQSWRIWRDSLFVYRCRYCSNYHVGHVPEPVRLLAAELAGPLSPYRNRLTYNLSMLESHVK